jgi:ribose transport system permease protein
VFIMAIITNIMNLLSVAAYPQLVVKGSIIILAVLLRSISDRSSDKLSAK